MKIKTSELIGPALDWAVAECEGEIYRPTSKYTVIGKDYPAHRYSTDWSQGGPIIERENITIIRANSDYVGGKWIPNWFAETSQCVGHSASESYEHQQMDPTFMISEEDGMYGPTPLIAAMRCFVASKLGDEVEVPDVLTGD